MREFACCALFVLLAPGVCSPAPAQPDGEPAQASLSERELRDALKKAQVRFVSYLDFRKRAKSADRNRKPDRFGRLPSADITRVVLTDSSRQQIEALFERAKAALDSQDLPAAQGAVDELSARLRAEGNEYAAIQIYWSKLGDHWPDRTAYLENLRRNGLTPHRQADIASFESLLQEQIRADHFYEAMSQTYLSLQSLYRDASAEDAFEIESALERGAAYEPLLAAKSDGTSCFTRTSPPEGTQKVKIAWPAPADGHSYEDRSKYQEHEGRARVYVLVSADACLQRAMITVTSGWPDLDATALRWALKSKFSAAVADSKPVDGGGGFWMEFELK